MNLKESTVKGLQMLDKHLDLLPLKKQIVAIWLCEEWRINGTKLPRQVRSRVSREFSYDLS